MKPQLLGFVIVLLSPIVGCAARQPLVVECSSSVKGSHIGAPALVGQEYGVQATPIPVNSVQFADWGTAKKLAIQHLYASRTPTNTVELTARFISCSDEPVSVKVRASFLDSNQMPTEPTSAWQTVFLQPRLTAVYADRSTAKNVSSFLVEVMGN
jgi:hypothetical protein